MCYWRCAAFVDTATAAATRDGLLPAGMRPRLIYRLHHYRRRKGECADFTLKEFKNLLQAAHQHLPGGMIVLVWDNLGIHHSAAMRVHRRPRRLAAGVLPARLRPRPQPRRERVVTTETLRGQLPGHRPGPAAADSEPAGP